MILRSRKIIERNSRPATSIRLFAWWLYHRLPNFVSKSNLSVSAPRHIRAVSQLPLGDLFLFPGRMFLADCVGRADTP